MRLRQKVFKFKMRWLIQRLRVETYCRICKLILCSLISKLVCRDNELIYFVTGVINPGFDGDRFGPVTASIDLSLGLAGYWVGSVGSGINLGLRFCRMTVLAGDIVTDKGKSTCCEYRGWFSFYLIINTHFFGITVDVLGAVLLTVICCLRFRLSICAHLFLGDQDWFYIRAQVN